MPDRKAMSIQDAMQANAEFFGFDLCDTITFGENGEQVNIVYRELLDKPTKARVEQVYRDYEECDRQEIEMTNDSGEVTKIQGAHKEPRMLKGEPFDLDEQLGIALWGQAQYDRYIAAGGPPGLITMTWNRMARQIQKRAKQDSKSS